MTNINVRIPESTPVQVAAPKSAQRDGKSWRRPRALLLGALLAALVVVAPFLLGSFWLQLLLLSGAAGVGALGLRFLVGVSGQLSLAHAFFIGIGAYGYAKLGPGVSGATVSSVGLPSAVAALCAILLAGLVGLLFSPIAARLRGIYLGLATLSLAVFGTDLLRNANSLGGAYGLDTAPLSIGGLRFSVDDPTVAVFGTPFGTEQALWFLVAVVLGLCFWFMRRMERTRAGRALKAVRDSPAAAASAGIHVQTYRSLAFVVSSLAAGVTGVLLALIYEHIVPENFGFTLSVLYLAMVVLGGTGSAVGSLFGALVVTGLPLILSEYSSAIPFLTQPGQSGGLDPGTLSQYVFGIVLIVVLLVRSTPISTKIAGTLRRRRVEEVNS
ncbi:branched-chain amino acid ABC transporter permease [Amycolatopsis sp. A1MSW2902]|uniref:branched-chain amino acid ABC transporter permease n=1 Tax=Amycolatopsis sp. A1MSW2902 TaxID=687413 RepID=UPI00307EFE2D